MTNEQVARLALLFTACVSFGVWQGSVAAAIFCYAAINIASLIKGD